MKQFKQIVFVILSSVLDIFDFCSFEQFKTFNLNFNEDLNLINKYRICLKLVLVWEVDLQHDCLIGLDYMGKVQETKDKFKDLASHQKLYSIHFDKNCKH
ncbi:hypothetical protein BpHYR1_051407 [Brachionus plicatilis]|uniref:Uncharacterized protein n=1 Tax=Brachionus plicatilis TaxID=10195 RepID=A0A3M7S2J8_BRAPC|nr:hypothetical protein BpHYR1_051407 [Brachionus plicatilis]